LSNRADLENELIYLGLLDKAREIFTELGDQASLSYIKSSHRLLSKVYHPDLNPSRKDRAQSIQQRLNRVSDIIARMKDAELIDVIRNGARDQAPSKKRILVVDDEVGVQELFRDVLIMEGYDVRVAADGEGGYIEYNRFTPHLILTDVVMPRISGLEMVRKIRDKDFRIKVIFMSGFFGIEGLKKELDAEIRKFGYPTLTKPFKMSVLLDLINDYMTGKDNGHFYRGI
jgi:CheY-like chemotaxis protein